MKVINPFRWKRISFLYLLSVWSICVFAQDKTPVEFGNVTANDFSPKTYQIDSSANAIVIAHIGNTEIYTRNGDVITAYSVYQRVRILDKNGYNRSNISFYLNRYDELTSLEAMTYSIENGNIIKSAVEPKKDLYKNHITKDITECRFTFPKVKEGSIVEYKYTITSHYITLRPWLFQSDIPTLWSEYTAKVPGFIQYTSLAQGYHIADIDTQKSVSTRYELGSRVYDVNRNEYRWVHKNVPAVKEEQYTSSLINNLTSIQFQLKQYSYPLVPKTYLDSWPVVTDYLMHNVYFGADLNKSNRWLNDDLKNITANIPDKKQEAEAVFSYLQKNIKSTGAEGIMASQLLKNVLAHKSGSVQEINLLLTAMLRKLGMKAEPVILSTRPHGFTVPIYPIMSQYNYVVCRLCLNRDTLYLDASDPFLGFGKLNSECYNSTARVIDKNATLIRRLMPSQITEKDGLILALHQSDSSFIGNVTYMPGYYKSKTIRKNINDKGLEKYKETLSQQINGNYTLSDITIDSLDNLNIGLKIHFNIDMPWTNSGVIYVLPMLIGKMSENPFKSPERHYPVEMPYKMKQDFICTMPIPDGYVVDEIPKSVKLKLDTTNDVIYNYIVSKTTNTITIRGQLSIKKTFFMPEVYHPLRSFYDDILKKQNETIVLKKKVISSALHE